MKPAWDQLGGEYESSSSVVIADVDCTVETDLCSDKGVSGYPTIKYYTPEHPDGESYSGGRDFDSLKKFVEDTLEVKCSVADPSECTDKEAKFIDKMKTAGADTVAKQLTRLEGMKGNKMNKNNKQWLFQRLNILSQLKDEL